MITSVQSRSSSRTLEMDAVPFIIETQASSARLSFRAGRAFTGSVMVNLRREPRFLKLLPPFARSFLGVVSGP